MLSSKRPTSKSQRTNRGQAVAALLAGVGVFVILAIGIFAFEISRYNLAQEQLKNCVDAAALAGQATLATYSPSSANNSTSQLGFTNATKAVNAQLAAANAAFKIFKKNSILGHDLQNARLTIGKSTGNPSNAEVLQKMPAPGSNQAEVFIDFILPAQGGNAADPNTSADQKIMRVTARYGAVPAFGVFLGIPAVPIASTGIAAIPMLDVICCFDVSGAMDDQTNVTFVKRVWAPPGYTSSGPRVYVPNPHVDYVPVTSGNGTPAEGPIARILGNPPLGSNLNALQPQGLENAANASLPLKFSETVPTCRLLRGVTNTGSPPGNAPNQVTPPNTVPAVGGSDVFTDLVVNLDDNAHFSGFTTPDGYSFPNVAVLVEAARGNLENQQVFQAAGLAGNPYFAGITPRAGYRVRGYEQSAQQVLKPFGPARNAFLNFSYALLHTNNCEMGEVSFNDHIDRQDTSYFIAPHVSSLYPQADSPKPGIYMLPNQWEMPMTYQIFNYYEQKCTGPEARVWGQTSNVGACLLHGPSVPEAAIDWLNDPRYHRPNADRAIVLFTNTAPPPSEVANARHAADEARSLGIPIYVVALAENANTKQAQIDAFGDQNSSNGSGGICAIAGHGGRFIQVTDEKDLPQAFGNVLRQLVKLAHNT